MATLRDFASPGRAAGIRSTAPACKPTVDEPLRCVWTVRSAAGSPAAVRRVLRARIAAWGGDPEVAFDAALLATELLTHAYLNCGPQALCRVEVEREAWGFRLTVADPHPAMPTRRRLGVWDEAGCSVRLLEALALRWGAEAGGAEAAGKRVWAELAVRCAACGE
ncbi:hypothetical protein BIV57_13615 [Mangrovactinospora gilvigrisea]|uniref:Histidine kinase/HSP90-like ATPase domain-containing protein n=1 Tax=Mangrovactinospora gilvigrisea TaxID=1428644 RepID=A0A1J7BE73_9ACTN|nr:hypothetical protein [Mangrovactinospora gilvigrisea]OIV36934.1 hypothetical protein BIV57_13615 [Mangrovactinospora gilvigrisea]